MSRYHPWSAAMETLWRNEAAFALTSASIIERIEATKTENYPPRPARNILFHKLMSGEIRLHEAEKLVTASAVRV